MAMTGKRRRQIDAANKRLRYRKRVAARLCTKCGVPADRVRCPDCLNEHNAYRRERRKEQKEMSHIQPIIDLRQGRMHIIRNPGQTDIKIATAGPYAVIGFGNRGAILGLRSDEPTTDIIDIKVE